MPEMWEDIRVNVIRSQPVDQNGPCANHRPADDDKTTVLEPGTDICKRNNVSLTLFKTMKIYPLKKKFFQKVSFFLQM
jgi:hypothetical protein